MRIRLKTDRLQQELSKKKVSLNRWEQMLGLGRGHLSLLLSGKRRYPNPETRHKLLEGLGVSFEDLFEIESKGPRRPFRRDGANAANGAGLFSGLAMDIRFGLRQLLKSPAWTLAVVLTLALGIAAHSAIFSAVFAVLIEPLPFPQPERLYSVGEVERTRNVEWQHLSRAEFRELQERLDIFQSLAAFEPHVLNWTPQAEPLQLSAGCVTPGYFETLGIQPTLGRTFSAQDSKRGRVLVVSEGFFRSHLGASRQALAEPLIIEGEDWQIIGIVPDFGISHPDLEFLASQQVWYPMPDRRSRRRSGSFTRVVARLGPGVTPERASEELAAVGEEWVAQFPAEYADRGYRLGMKSLQHWAVEDARPTLTAFAMAVALLLLLICLNLANLQLARAEARGGEFALRMALGAGRLRLMRQFAVEGGLLALTAAVGGLLLAAWGIPLLRSINPQAMPRFEEVEVGLASLMAALLAALAAVAIWVLVLALQVWGRSSRLNFGASGLGRGSVSAGALRLPSAMVVAQIALALLLLVSGGLMLRSFEQVMSVSPGFNPDRVIGFRLVLSDRYADRQARLNYFEQVLERLNSIPEMRAGLVSRLPLLWELTRPVSPHPGDSNRSPQPVEAGYRLVHGSYFQTMGIDLLSGRLFQEIDRDGPLTAIVDENLAERLWPGQDPLGRRFKQGEPSAESPWRTVVGVVRHVKHRGLERQSRSQYYIPLVQSPLAASSMFVVVRSLPDGPAEGRMVDVRRAVWSVDSEIPLSELAPMSHRLSNDLQGRRFVTSLFGLFSLLGLALGAVGLFGLISFNVNRRVQEIGVRLALGAGRGDILRLIVGRGMFLCGLGVAGGLAISLLVGRYLSNLLFRVSPTDPLVLAVSVVFFAVVAALSSYLPARRASRIDPAEVIRQA
ncbi:MAG TPA: ADOP family duplicated permease [Acidobacteriota bacterium]|nr:ADOP family duplicated permease [Acidobacteriota bacterium]